MNNKIYWLDFNKKFKEKNPSRFAKFIIDFLHNKEYISNIIDLGCGVLRNSYYFLKKGYEIYAIDPYISKGFEYKNMHVIKSFYPSLRYCNIHSVYIQFVLHCLSEKYQTKILKKIYNDLILNGFLFIEDRTDKDISFINKEIYKNHNRRLINFINLKDELIKLGFKIIYSIESNNLTIYKNQNPIVCRIIAQK